RGGAKATDPHHGGAWLRWSQFVQGHSWTIAVASTLAILLIAAPATALRLGSSDAGNDPTGFTTHKAYELLAEGFGKGFNGPLLVVAKLSGAGGAASDLRDLESALASTSGVVSTTPPRVSPSGGVATISVYPSSSPQEYATTQLVSRLRNQVILPVAARTGMHVYVGGITAGGVDFASVLGKKLPVFIGVVVLLSA